MPDPKWPAPEIRFWRKVDKNGPNGCWRWVGYISTDGYGQLEVHGRKEKAHRYSWELHPRP